MRFTLNGAPRDGADGLTLGALLTELGLRVEALAVAKNGAVVPRAALPTTPIQDADQIELVRAVGGG